MTKSSISSCAPVGRGQPKSGYSFREKQFQELFPERAHGEKRALRSPPRDNDGRCGYPRRGRLRPASKTKARPLPDVFVAMVLRQTAWRSEK
jgi:hypothetical protein